MTHSHNNLAITLPDFACSPGKRTTFYFGIRFHKRIKSNYFVFFHRRIIILFFILELLQAVHQMKREKMAENVFFVETFIDPFTHHFHKVASVQSQYVLCFVFSLAHLHSRHKHHTPYRHSMVQQNQDLSSKMNFINLIENIFSSFAMQIQTTTKRIFLAAHFRCRRHHHNRHLMVSTLCKFLANVFVNLRSRDASQMIWSKNNAAFQMNTHIARTHQTF